MKQIVSMGTSLSHAGGWLPELYRYLIVGHSSRISAACIGRSGEASDWGVANVGVLTRMRPDIALIEFAINDAYTAKGISLSQSEANITTIVQAIQTDSPHTEIFLLTMNPTLGAGASVRPNLPDYYALYNSLAPSLGVGLVDAFTVWGSPTTVEIPDGIHPTLAALQAVFLPLLSAAISPLIE